MTAELRKVHQYLTFATFAPAQWALAEMLAEQPSHHLELADFYQAKRDRFRALLADTPLTLRDVPGGRRALAEADHLPHPTRAIAAAAGIGCCAGI